MRGGEIPALRKCEEAASEGARGRPERFPTQTLQRRPPCQPGPHQFEEVESAPGRLRLTLSLLEEEEEESRGRNLPVRSLPPQQGDPLLTHFTRFSLGASQGAAGAWGFHLQSCTLHTPGRWRRRPQPTPAVREES